MSMGQQYRVLTGLDYPGGRCEPGDVTEAIPAKSVKWLVEQGHIEPVAPSRPVKGSQKRDIGEPDLDTTPDPSTPVGPSEAVTEPEEV